MDIVYRATLGADCLIFIGMSGTVTDTATLAEIAKSKGKTVIEINTAKSTPASPYADFYLQMKSDEALSKLIEKLY
jgi:NAD-dependent deacetylase